MPEPGDRFGDYELLGLLGRGGMGEVYRAHDHKHHRIVALKVLPVMLADNERFVERFRREARAAVQLNDPHVVPIHHYGEIDGRLYIDMQLIEGRDLATIIDGSGPLAAARAVDVVRQAAQGLEAAHARNLVHRDVKPSNLLVVEDKNDFTYLVDFGIAHVITSTTTGSNLTSKGSAVGTWAYMAPERFLGVDDVDGRVDVYSLACVLHEALTGRRPFPFEEPPALLHAHLNLEPPSVTLRRPDLSGDWDAVIHRGMAKRPQDRYGTPRELADDAARVLAGVRPAATATRDLPQLQGAQPHLPPPPLPDLSSGRSHAPTYIPPRPPPHSSDQAITRPPVTGPQRVGGAGAASWIVAAVAMTLVVVLGTFVVVGNFSGLDANAQGSDRTTAPGAGASETPPTSGDRSGSTSQGPSSTTGPRPDVPAPLPPPPDADLGLSQPISTPVCDGSYVLFVFSSVDPARYSTEIREVLDQYPGSSYLLAGVCSSLRARNEVGNLIYSVYYGPYPTLGEACAAQARVGGGSYIRQLDNVSPVGEVFSC